MPISSPAESANQPLRAAVAIVTGGASGIGRATCQALARVGARVVVADLAQTQIDVVLADLKAEPRGDHLGLAVDVRSEADIQRLVEQTLDRFGRIDILVACAGILRGDGGTLKPLAQLATPEWDQVIDTNLRGLFLCNRAVLPAMIRQRRGDIINLSSVSGRQGRAHDAPYCASKFGVIGLSESLAAEVQQFGVRVQTVLPDAVNTAFWQQNGPVPMPPHSLPPERVADLILFMLALPPDTQILAPVIAPLQVRRRGVGKAAKNDPAG
ncbi:MAG: SDR family oxidoreductase [Candidatus Competibacteraceae bacterium]|nr:SDR family oxidoreductase [Candidatus Competibacteraceae bacterium]MBK9951378.1 SDR family oxidoreductase [Candidatus Competibacteraceae bacterium]